MTYLVSSDFGIKEVEEYDEVLNILKKCTAYWCADDDYDGEDYQTLYNTCLEECDFGDIAHVYQVDTYFKAGKSKIPCELSIAEKNTNFTMKRIF